MATETKAEKPKRSRKTKAEVPDVEPEGLEEAVNEAVGDAQPDEEDGLGEPDPMEPGEALSEEQLANLTEAREAWRRQDREQTQRVKGDFQAVVKSKPFAKAVALVSRGVSGRSTQPVQCNVFLQTQEAGAVRLVATDLEFVQVEVLLAAEACGNGALTLPPQVLLPLANSLPECDLLLTGEATDTPAKGRLFSESAAVSGISAARTRLNLRGMDARDYETLAPMPEGAVEFDVDQGLLKQVLAQVRPAVSTEETRPTLTGVLVELDGYTARFIATDTHRLALREVGVTYHAKAREQYILSAAVLAHLEALLDPTSEARITVRLSDRQAEFTGLGPNGEITLGSRVIDGQFPDFAKVVPDQTERRVTVHREEFEQALRRVLIIAKEDAYRVTFSPSEDGGLTLSAESPDVGDIAVDVAAEWEGEANAIAFNGRYALDALLGSRDEYASLNLSGPLNPGVFETGGLKYVLMPMQK